MIKQGLVIAEPYLSQILSGTKVWELRSLPTTKRGPIALIKKGSGHVVGTANIDGVGERLTPENFGQFFEQHRFPIEATRGGNFRWWVPWHLSCIVRLENPIPYDHPSGAVTWVNLSEKVSRQLICSVVSSTGSDETEIDPLLRQAHALDREIEALRPQGAPGGTRFAVNAVATIVLGLSALAWFFYTLFAIATWSGQFSVFLTLGISIALSSALMGLTADQQKVI